MCDRNAMLRVKLQILWRGVGSMRRDQPFAHEPMIRQPLRRGNAMQSAHGVEFQIALRHMNSDAAIEIARRGHGAL